MVGRTFKFSDLFDAPLPRLKVVDVGALPVDGQEEVYQDLLDRGLCDVIAFEPDVGLCERLNGESDGPRKFLSYFIGDGQEGIFKRCKAPMTSPLYEPNTALLDLFQNLSKLLQVVSRERVETVRLDSLDSVAGADFLKLDVQGAERAVIAVDDVQYEHRVVQCVQKNN